MPKLPRNLSGRELGIALGTLGYEFIRQSGSHMRYRTMLNGEHSVTIVDGRLNVKTISRLLKDVAGHHALTMDQLTGMLFH